MVNKNTSGDFFFNTYFRAPQQTNKSEPLSGGIQNVQFDKGDRYKIWEPPSSITFIFPSLTFYDFNLTLDLVSRNLEKVIQVEKREARIFVILYYSKPE